MKHFGKILFSVTAFFLVASLGGCGTREQVAVEQPAQINYQIRLVEDLGQPFSIPVTNWMGPDTMALSPDAKQIVFLDNTFTRQRIYTASFPPENSASYSQVTSIPNYRGNASDIAWCLEDHSRIAVSGFYIYTTPEIPDINDGPEYVRWLEENPQWTFGRINGVSTTKIDDSMGGFYVSSVSLSDSSYTKILKIPLDIMPEPLYTYVRVCWPSKNEMFLSVGSSIYKVDSLDTEPRLTLSYKYPSRSDIGSHGWIHYLTFDPETKSLCVVRFCRELSDDMKFFLVTGKLDPVNNVMIEEYRLPFSGKPAFTGALSSQNGFLAALYMDAFYVGNIINKQLPWVKIPVSKMTPQYPWIDAVSSDGTTVVLHLPIRNICRYWNLPQVEKP